LSETLTPNLYGYVTVTTLMGLLPVELLHNWFLTPDIADVQPALKHR